MTGSLMLRMCAVLVAGLSGELAQHGPARPGGCARVGGVEQYAVVAESLEQLFAAARLFGDVGGATGSCSSGLRRVP